MCLPYVTWMIEKVVLYDLCHETLCGCIFLSETAFHLWKSSCKLSILIIFSGEWIYVCIPLLFYFSHYPSPFQFLLICLPCFLLKSIPLKNAKCCHMRELPLSNPKEDHCDVPNVRGGPMGPSGVPKHPIFLCLLTLLINRKFNKWNYQYFPSILDLGQPLFYKLSLLLIYFLFVLANIRSAISLKRHHAPIKGG